MFVCVLYSGKRDLRTDGEGEGAACTQSGGPQINRRDAVDYRGSQFNSPHAENPSWGHLEDCDVGVAFRPLEPLTTAGSGCTQRMLGLSCVYYIRGYWSRSSSVWL